MLSLLAVGFGLASPALSSQISKQAAPGEVGGVLGIFEALRSVARIIGPFVGELAYGGAGVRWPFRIAAVFMLLACAVSGLLRQRLGREPAAGS